MSYDHPEFAGSKIHKKVLRPKDSATLILVRRDSATPRILMGQRSGGHAFMPNKYVFPGGRLDAADSRVKPARDLHPATLAKLMARMRGKPSASRARGLAHAAVRETWEETGLLFGKKAVEEAPDLLRPHPLHARRSPLRPAAPGATTAASSWQMRKASPTSTSPTTTAAANS
jgi:8-oxo-dGTP pyrophosphatase MutT (NUDIX family)